MNKATQQNYIKHFGPDAVVPGYCGKCPGSGKIENDPVCLVFADDPAPRILPDEHGCNEPPDWCPIRHISRRPLTAEIEQLRASIASAPPPAVVHIYPDSYKTWYERETTKDKHQ